MAKKYRTKVSFWATTCSNKFLDKRAERVYNRLLKLEDEISKLREYLFNQFTKPQPVKFKFHYRKKKYKKVKK